MNSENNRKTRLQKLGGSEFEMKDEQPDIRGWEVKDSLGKQLGEVEELIFDFQSRKVRYLVADLHKNDYGLETKKVLVPIGIAEIHENDDDIILPGITPDQVRALPEYDEDRFDTEQEASIRNVFGGLGAAASSGVHVNEEDFYAHDHFNEANLYRNRNRGKVKDRITAPVNQLGQDESRIENLTGLPPQPGDVDGTDPIYPDESPTRKNDEEGLNDYPIR